MSMGYMGYVKFDTMVVLTTGANVSEVIEPIYSSSVRGAGWYHAGTAHYIDDIIRYEGNIDFEMQPRIWTFLKDWLVEARTTSKTVVISPDGTISYTFTGGGSGAEGSLTGLWTSSANFSASEGGVVTCSLGVLGLERDENTTGATYKDKNTVLDYTDISLTVPLNADRKDQNPYPYWNTIAYIKKSGLSIFAVGTEALDWNVDVSQNPVVVYACVGAQGPLALFMGEMEASASISVMNLAGVAGIPTGCTADNTTVEIKLASLSGTSNWLTLPRAVFDNDGHDLSGGDSVISRTFSLKGLAGISSGVLRLPAFYMKEAA